jgi:DNA-binding protein H-NS
MATPNLRTMDIPALLNLQGRVNEVLSQRRTELQKQLALLDGSTGTIGRGRRAVSKLKGIKVAPKYRGPSGETWAGRGATPTWLVAAVKDSGKKLTDFLIDKPAAVVRKKRRAKNNKFAFTLFD